MTPQAIFEAQFIKTLSNDVVELKKGLANIKASVYVNSTTVYHSNLDKGFF